MKNKVSKLLRRTTSVVLAGVMTGSTVTASAVAAPVTSTTQSFSMGRVGTVFDSVKNLLTGEGPVKRDTHSTADTFSSKRLIVKADKLRNIDKKNVIASYGGYYLLKYDSKANAKEAYETYKEYDGGETPIAADQPVHMATGDADSGGLTNVTKSDNPLTELKENVADITKSEVKSAKKKKVIALLDTGASKSSNVIETVSMLGGSASDDNGHGEKMVKRIKEHNKDAQIISIKVLNSSGEGSVSSIVAGIAYAEKRGASIINMSLSGRATEGNSIVTSVVTNAISKGLTVIGAAGNYGSDAADYIPGSIKDALIVGACDSKGNRISSSNYGETVDYNVVADSTSEAVAITSGYVSANMNDDGSYSLPVSDATLFFRASQNKSDIESSKCSITLGDSNTKAKLYYAGKLVKELGASTNLYKEKNVNLSSIKISTSNKVIEVIYPNGTVQHYTDKTVVLNVLSGNSGSYIIQSLTDDEYAMDKKYESDSFYKNPQATKALNDRNAYGKFEAQASSVPDTISGYGWYAARERHRQPYAIYGVHVNGYSSSDVKWKGTAHCIESKAVHRTDLGSNGEHYDFISSKKGKKVGDWQWYTVITFRHSWMPWKPAYTVHGVQRLQIQVAIRVPDEPTPTERTVKKVWKNHDKKPVKVKLKRFKGGISDGYVTKEITLNAANNWTYTKKELPKKSSGGKAYTYKWIETSKFTGVSKITKTSGTTDTIVNTGTTHEHKDYTYSIDKTWLGDDTPSNVEVCARVTFKHNTYNVDQKGKRTTLKNSNEEHEDYTINDSNDWHAEGTKSVADKEKEEYTDFRWYEYGWRYVGEPTWQTDWVNHPIPNWGRADINGKGYGGKDQCFLNYAAPTTKMTIEKDWKNTEVADSVVFHLYGDTPEGTVDFGEVTLTKAGGWYGEIGKNATIKCPEYTYTDGHHYSAQTIVYDLPVYYTRTDGVLDFHVPCSSAGGFHVDEETAEFYRIKYRWVEDTAKTTYKGFDISKLIASCDVTTDNQPDEGAYEEGGSGSAENTSTTPRLTSYATDSSTGTKAGKVKTDENGEKYIEFNETVNMWDVGPGNEYTLVTGVIKNDGTAVTPAWYETSFIPEQLNTFKYENQSTFASVNVTASIYLGDFDPAGSTLVVTETLLDDNDDAVATESNAGNKDQSLYYPAIKTHMVSDNPLNDLAHKYDGTFDSDGKHYGSTAENETDRDITMTDTVAYKNLYSGSYVIRGELHRKDRNSDHDFGVVATSNSGTFNVNADDGAADGSVAVRYSFNYTDDMFGSDFVSYERLYYAGDGHNDDLASHADINDKSQTVRMPTRIRIVKKDQETGSPQAHAKIGLYTKDDNGNLKEYMHNGKHYVLETDDKGTALFCNLDPGEYWFKELQSSDAHNLTASPFKVNAEYYKTRQMVLDEQKIVELTTGGTGTTVYYIIAGIVAAGCAATYVIQKRRKAK